MKGKMTAKQRGATILRWLALGLLSLVVAAVAIVLFFYGFENWRGRRAWRLHRESLAARGEKLQWKDYLPPPVADSENFSKAPIVDALMFRGHRAAGGSEKLSRLKGLGLGTPLGDFWSGRLTDLGWSDARLSASDDLDPKDPTGNHPEGVLEGFRSLEAELEQIRQAASRPHSQLVLPETYSISLPLPDYVMARTLAQAFSIHAAAEIATTNSAQAFRDARVLHQLSKAVGSQPVLVSAMIHVSISEGMELQVFWEGLRAGVWTEPQLREFQETFASMDLLADVDRGLRGAEWSGLLGIAESCAPREYRALVGVEGSSEPSDSRGRWLRRSVEWGPSGWRYQNLLVHSLAMQERFSTYSVSKHQIDASGVRSQNAALSVARSAYGPFDLLVAIAMPNVGKALYSVARSQTGIGMASVACALERHRLARGEYPAGLAELGADAATSLPRDIISGRDLRYRRNADGTYLLYGVGWNAVDDGGVPAKGSGDAEQGDWVWPGKIAVQIRSK